MELSLKKSSNTETQTLVIFAAKSEKNKTPVSSGLPAEVQNLLNRASEDRVFSGDKKKPLFIEMFRSEALKIFCSSALEKLRVSNQNKFVSQGSLAYQALKASKSTNGAISLDSL